MKNYAMTISLAFSVIKAEIMNELTTAKIINYHDYEIKKISKMYEELRICYTAPIQNRMLDILNEIVEFNGVIAKVNSVSKKASELIKFIELKKSNELNDSDYEELISKIKLNVFDGVKLSEWIVINGHCATRVYLDQNVNDPQNRVAFIEKTPMVRLTPYSNKENEEHNWFFGEKGEAGSNGSNPENGFYGFDKDSRDWSDEMLKMMGFVF